MSDHRFKKISLRAEYVGINGAPYNFDAILQPDDAAKLIRKLLQDDREQVIAIPLDIRNKPIGFYTVGVGSVDSCATDVREMFRVAILLGASGIMLAHNHPSGNCVPGKEDIALTVRAISAGQLLSVSVVDHIVVSVNSHTSIRGVMPNMFSK